MLKHHYDCLLNKCPILFITLLTVCGFFFFKRHYPHQKPTVVSDNPEMLRIKENTKIQSNVSDRNLIKFLKFLILIDNFLLFFILPRRNIMRISKSQKEFTRL